MKIKTNKDLEHELEAIMNIDQWKQANDTLRGIEKELRWAREEGDDKHEAWMLNEKRECNALIRRLEERTNEETTNKQTKRLSESTPLKLGFGIALEG